MTAIERADRKDIRALSRKLLTLFEDKNSQIYKENVTKFGIPEEYVRKAFAEETLLEAATKGKTVFYLALENAEIIGFAQTIQKDASTVELDRIIIFPPHAGKGIGTQLLRRVLVEQEQREIYTVIVNTGKEETQARRFYEKNGFKQMKEVTVEAPWGKKLSLVTYKFQVKR
jgi:N-acetylglutamate synthase-like GNAT family acetyltransferase